MEVKPSASRSPTPLIRLGRAYWLTGVVLACADALVFTACCVASVLLWARVEGQLDPADYWSLWPLVGIFLLASAATKLYPGVGTHPVEEFRRQILIISFVFLGLATMTFMTRQGVVYSRAVFALAWVQCVVAVPIARSITKLVFKRASWFGYPAVIFADGRAAMEILSQLSRNPTLGLRARAVVGDLPVQDKGAPIDGVPVVDLRAVTPMLREAGRVPYALVSTAGYSRERLEALLAGPLQSFRHVILVPDLPLPSTLWMAGRDLGGMFGLEVEHRLLDPWRRALKRGIDLLALLVLLPIFVPVCLVLALLIRLDSPGPVLVRLRRVGSSGRLFHQLKFRTMVVNNDAVLRKALDSDPALREEWETTQKLRNDPRLTRVGRWLRRTSVDELPQIFNVLGGQMSLVGPRPITTGETSKYKDLVGVYARVLPGMTGLWQVSGRNELDYDKRVQLDAYYVRNWSVWLDLYIAVKTVWVVLTGRGAY